MSGIGMRLGLIGRPSLGQGQQLDPKDVPTPTPVPYADFRGGLDLSQAPESIATNAASKANDIEVSPDNRLRAAPGHALVQTMDHLPDGIFLHGSTDGFTKMFFLAAPYVGIMDDTTGPVWSNVGLGAKSIYPWAGISVLDKLLVSNGSTYTGAFDFSVAGVTDISSEVIARAFGAAFGRIFAGGTATESMIVFWNDASGDPLSWSGLGSGAEFLIPNSGTADSIVAIRGIGSDLLVVLCKNSIWLARPTGQSDRPADFRPQYNGIGAVSASTVASFPDGLIFLSEQGIVVLTAGSMNVVSGPINPELLPIADNGAYSGEYDPGLHRYYLSHNSIPTTWVYDLPIAGVRDGRFFKRTYGAEFIKSFPQTAGLATGSINYLVLFVDPNAALNLYKETYFSSTYYNAVRTPVWETGYSSKLRVTDIFTTVGYEIEFSTTGAAQIGLTAPDSDGVFSQALFVDLPDTANKLKRMIVEGVSVGQGVACQILLSGPVKLARITQLIQPESQGLLHP